MPTVDGPNLGDWRPSWPRPRDRSGRRRPLRRRADTTVGGPGTDPSGMTVLQQCWELISSVGTGTSGSIGFPNDQRVQLPPNVFADGAKHWFPAREVDPHTARCPSLRSVDGSREAGHEIAGVQDVTPGSGHRGVPCGDESDGGRHNRHAKRLTQGFRTAALDVRVCPGSGKAGDIRMWHP